MPDLGHLRVFVAVAEELNFTRAARRLFLAQQAVSKSVAALERDLGVTLLERGPVRLTPAGAALLDAAPHVLAGADAAFTRARAAGGVRAETVTVGMSPAVGPADRAEVVRVLRAGTDGLIAVVDVQPTAIATLLRNGALDLAVARTRTDPGLASAALRPTAAVLHVPGRHPLAGAGPVRLAQLDGHRVLTWNRLGTPLTDLLLARLAAAGATVEPVPARITGAAVLDDLSSLDAVAVLPHDWPTTPGSCRVPLAEELLLPLQVLWGGRIRSLAVERLQAEMAATA